MVLDIIKLPIDEEIRVPSTVTGIKASIKQDGDFNVQILGKVDEEDFWTPIPMFNLSSGKLVTIIEGGNTIVELDVVGLSFLKAAAESNLVDIVCKLLG